MKDEDIAAIQILLDLAYDVRDVATDDEKLAIAHVSTLLAWERQKNTPAPKADSMHESLL